MIIALITILQLTGLASPTLCPACCYEEGEPDPSSKTNFYISMKKGAEVCQEQILSLLLFASFDIWFIIFRARFKRD